MLRGRKVTSHYKGVVGYYCWHVGLERLKDTFESIQPAKLTTSWICSGGKVQFILHHRRNALAILPTLYPTSRTEALLLDTAVRVWSQGSQRAPE